MRKPDAGEESEQETMAGPDFPSDLPEDSLLSYDPSQTHLRIAPGVSDSMRLNASQLPTSDNIQMSRWALRLEKGMEDGVEEEEVGQGGSTFRLRKIVGKGGFGEVWEAVQVSLNRIVAVKRLRRDILQGDEEDRSLMSKVMKAEFRQEAVTTANLDHPNIVPVHDLGVDEDGSPLIAMKYVRGDPWNKLIEDEFNATDPAEFLARHIPILVQVTQAVAFAHSRGVVHRDLKPAQVIVGEFGEVLLADWGLSMVFDREALARVGQRIDLQFLHTADSASNPAGTPAFMAPEQTERRPNRIGPWTDVYLLGGILYYLLTAKPPHQAVSTREAFLRASLGDVPPPEKATPGRDMPPELVDLAMIAMKPDIKDRLQTAGEFLHLIQDYLSGSSRRRESLTITDQVARDLEKKGATYGDFGHCIGHVSRAQALWGDNPSISWLSQRSHTQWCRAALANDDLVLARLQAESLEPSEIRDQLLIAVSQAEDRARRRERIRHWSISFVGIFFMGMLALGTWFNRQVMVERDNALAERDKAQTARNDAHRLVNFMLTDLRESLEPSAQLEPLLQVGQSVLDYYNRVPEDEASIETKRQRALALRTVGLVQRQLGDSGLALDLLRQFNEACVEIVAEEPGNEEWLSQLGYSHILIGQVLADQGDIKGQQVNLARALAAAVKAALRTLGPEADDGSIAREDLDKINSFLLAQDDLSGLGADQEKLVEVVDRLVASKQNDPDWTGDMATAYSWLGDAFLRQGNIGLARVTFERELKVREFLSKEYPSDGGFRIDLAESLMRTGQLSESEGEQVLANEAYSKALDIAQRGRVEEPSQPRWLRLLAAVHLRRSTLHLAAEDLPRAVAEGDMGLDQAQTLASRDSNNALWQHTLLKAVLQAGRARAASGRLADAKRAYESGLLVAERLAYKDPNSNLWRGDIVTLVGAYIALGEAFEGQNDLNALAEICATAGITLTTLAPVPGVAELEQVWAKACH